MTTLEQPRTLLWALTDPQDGEKYRQQLLHLAQDSEQGNTVIPLMVALVKYRELIKTVMSYPPFQSFEVNLAGKGEEVRKRVRLVLLVDKWSEWCGIWISATCPVTPIGREDIPQKLRVVKH